MSGLDVGNEEGEHSDKGEAEEDEGGKDEKRHGRDS